MDNRFPQAAVNRPDPAVLEDLRVSCRVLLDDRATFDDRYLSALGGMLPDRHPLRAVPGTALDLLDVVLRLILTGVPAGRAEQDFQMCGERCALSGLPDDTFPAVGRAIGRAAREQAGEAWTSITSSGWAAVHLWLVEHLTLGATAARLQAQQPEPEPVPPEPVQPPPPVDPAALRAAETAAEWARLEQAALGRRPGGPADVPAPGQGPGTGAIPGLRPGAPGPASGPIHPPGSGASVGSVPPAPPAPAVPPAPAGPPGLSLPRSPIGPFPVPGTAPPTWGPGSGPRPGGAHIAEPGGRARRPGAPSPDGGDPAGTGGLATGVAGSGGPGSGVPAKGVPGVAGEAPPRGRSGRRVRRSDGAAPSPDWKGDVWSQSEELSNWAFDRLGRDPSEGDGPSRP